MAWFFFTGLHVALIVGLMGYNIYIIANLTKHGYVSTLPVHDDLWIDTHLRAR